MTGPLTGFKIVEIAGIGPAPFAAMMLADMGAEVVRVERSDAVSGPAPEAPHRDLPPPNRRNLPANRNHPNAVAGWPAPVPAAAPRTEGLPPGGRERPG